MSVSAALSDLDDLTHVTHILLDMDGTLLDLHYDNVFWGDTLPRHWAQVHGHDPDTAALKLRDTFESQRGQLTWYSLPFWEQTLQVDLVALQQAHRHQIKLLTDTVPVLEALKQAGKTLWLVTNADPQVMQTKLAQTGIASFFEICITSHDVGLPKEQPGFWDAFQAGYPFPKQHAIFVDDTGSVLARAAQAGLAAVFAMAQPDSTLAPKDHPTLPTLSRLSDLLSWLQVSPVVAQNH